MKKIAVYGKGGIGKSTTVSNIAAALAKKGLCVMQIGCDPKADSTKNLHHLNSIPTVLDSIRDKDEVKLEDIVFKSDLGVLCVEAGGPSPGVGCAGRGIIAAFEKLEELDAFSYYNPDIVLYDVLGDVVCGGFAMPIRQGYAKEVYIVTSGEMMSMYAASNIANAVKNLSPESGTKLSGVILNSKNVANELQKVEELCEEINSNIIAVIPRDGLIQEAENELKTVVQAFPESDISNYYDKLADIIWTSGGNV